jgi:hypothetical protein
MQMASDLKDLEKRLNADTDLRDKFIKNPVTFLKGEGITLPPAQAKALSAAIAKVKIPKATAGKAARSVRISITITISIGKAAAKK